MPTGDIKCPECNGTGTVLKHHYGRGYNNILGNAGAGMGFCPRCHGRGTVRGNVPEEVRGVESGSSSGELYIVIAFVVVWLGLFYLTYKLSVPILEAVYGKDPKVSDAVKWLNVVIISIPPTVVVYLARKIIPGLFYLGVIIGILFIAYKFATN